MGGRGGGGLRLTLEPENGRGGGGGGGGGSECPLLESDGEDEVGSSAWSLSATDCERDE